MNSNRYKIQNMRRRAASLSYNSLWCHHHQRTAHALAISPLSQTYVVRNIFGFSRRALLNIMLKLAKERRMMVCMTGGGGRALAPKHKNVFKAAVSQPCLSNAVRVTATPMDVFLPLVPIVQWSMPTLASSSHHLIHLVIASSHLRTAARPPLINSSSDRPPPTPPFESTLALAPPFTRPFCCCCRWAGPFFPLPPAAPPPFPPLFFPLTEYPASLYTAGIAATAAAAAAASVVSNRPPPAPTPRGFCCRCCCCLDALNPAPPALAAIEKPPRPSGMTRLPPPPRLRDDRSTLRLLGPSRGRTQKKQSSSGNESSGEFSIFRGGRYQ